MEQRLRRLCVCARVGRRVIDGALEDTVGSPMDASGAGRGERSYKDYRNYVSHRRVVTEEHQPRVGYE